LASNNSSATYADWNRTWCCFRVGRMKLETCFPSLLKDTYIIHETGGFHPFKDVAEAAPIFKQDCWPFIQRIHWPEKKDTGNAWRQKNHRPKQMNLNVSVMHIYPYISLCGEGERQVFTKNRKPRWTYESVGIKMHIAVARMFILNPHKKTQVCHINDDPMDYRVKNLKWGTNQENHTGRRGDKVDYNSLHKICKINGWAKGEENEVE